MVHFEIGCAIGLVEWCRFVYITRKCRLHALRRIGNYPRTANKSRGQYSSSLVALAYLLALQRVFPVIFSTAFDSAILTDNPFRVFPD